MVITPINDVCPLSGLSPRKDTKRRPCAALTTGPVAALPAHGRLGPHQPFERLCAGRHPQRLQQLCFVNHAGHRQQPSLWLIREHRDRPLALQGGDGCGGIRRVFVQHAEVGLQFGLRQGLRRIAQHQPRHRSTPFGAHQQLLPPALESPKQRSTQSPQFILLICPQCVVGVDAAGVGAVALEQEVVQRGLRVLEGLPLLRVKRADATDQARYGGQHDQDADQAATTEQQSSLHPAQGVDLIDGHCRRGRMHGDSPWMMVVRWRLR
ncbi:hypothetical protein B0X78_00740 [bacterium AM6]|nr:hypothetical protein B0X78_00740 [bacterium AM6]